MTKSVCQRTLRGAVNELFLASLGLAGLDLKLPRFFVQTPRTRRGSYSTGNRSPLVAVHREQGPLAAPAAFPSDDNKTTPSNSAL